MLLARRMRPGLPLLLVFALALAACAPDAASSSSEGPPPPPAAGARAHNRAGRTTRGSNTQLAMPQNLLLADVDGDGISDFVRYDGNDVSVASTSFEQTGLLHLFTGRPVKRVLTGDFHGDRRDQVCAITDDNALACYGISSDKHALWWWFTQGTFVGDNEAAVVGDFDADGRDDVLVYPRAGGAYRMYSIKGDAFFAATPSFNPGNLGTAAAGLQLRAGDFGGDGRDDLLIVNPAGQMISYASVWDGTSHTFWWAFTSSGGLVGAADQVTVARVDDDMVDEVVLRNRTSGATRFLRLEFNGGNPPALGNVAIGQLSTAGNSLVFWGALHGAVQEPGGATRDDALVYDLGTGMFNRADARWDGSQLTYWWAYTQYAPGAGPVDGAARVGGASPLVKAYTEHLGRLTGAPPNDFGGGLGIVGTDLGVSYETPRGLAFLFGDSWTVVPGVRQDQDSFGYSTAASVARLAMPVVSWVRNVSGSFREFVVPGVNLAGMNVPIEGIALGNTQYVFFDSGWNGTRHTRSILAHFDGNDPASMVKDHDVASDKFINVSAVNEGNMIYLYGNGVYRQSAVYLARVEPWNLADRGRWQYFRGMRRGEPVFGPGEASAVELVNDHCAGELSVRKHPARQLYFMTYNCDAPRGIRMRTAATPTGPWTDREILFDPGATDRGYEWIMHANESAVGHDDGLAEPYGSDPRRNEWGGEYGPYLVPRWFRSEANGVERIVYTMSTWNPYQIHLMETVLVPPGTSYTPPTRGLGLPRASLVNGDFASYDVRGWSTSGDGATFPIFTGSDGRPRLSTYTPAKHDAAMGAIWQDFTVDAATSELRFKLHGGDGTIKLYRGGELLRRSQGRRTNDVETQVIWKLDEYRGDTLRIVIEDYSTAAWGFVGVSGIELR